LSSGTISPLHCGQASISSRSFDKVIRFLQGDIHIFYSKPHSKSNAKPRFIAGSSRNHSGKAKPCREPFDKGYICRSSVLSLELKIHLTQRRKNAKRPLQ
jgi:hypothetical protein